MQKKILAIISLSILLSCNSKPNIKSEKSKTHTEDSTKTIEKKKIPVTNVKIDSVKMHAFDNIYFGFQNDPIASKYTINDIDYSISSSQSIPYKGLSYFMLENDSKIKTEKKAKKILNDLKNTISRKYSNVIVLNKSLFIKHPEEQEKDEVFFDKRSLYKYDEKIIGFPYEFIACQWNLKYKTIQIGYFIDYKNKTRIFGSAPKDDNYIVYLEFQSKIVKTEKSNPPDLKKDSKRF